MPKLRKSPDVASVARLDLRFGPCEMGGASAPRALWEGTQKRRRIDPARGLECLRPPVAVKSVITSDGHGVAAKGVLQSRRIGESDHKTL